MLCTYHKLIQSSILVQQAPGSVTNSLSSRPVVDFASVGLFPLVDRSINYISIVVVNKYLKNSIIFKAVVTHIKKYNVSIDGIILIIENEKRNLRVLILQVDLYAIIH